MISLSSNQQKIMDGSSNLLITGGPGSGKTTVAILKAKKEVGNLAEFQQVLFLSFSNSATHQIRQASGSNFSRDEGQQVQIQTFHSFCLSILKSYGKIAGIKNPVRVYPPEEVATIASKQRFITGEQLEGYLYQEAIRNGIICFDLFAELTAKVLRRSKQILRLLQSCYPVIIVDEFQDTDTAQWELISLMGEESTLICLADPLQKIYDFRPGVSKERLQHFRDQFSPDCVDLGGVNYRSKGNEILVFADSILHRRKRPQLSHFSFSAYKYDRQIGFYLKKAIMEMQRKLRAEKSINNPKISVFTRTNQSASFLSSHLNKKTSSLNFRIKHEVLLDESKICQWYNKNGRLWRINNGHLWRRKVPTYDGDGHSI